MSGSSDSPAVDPPPAPWVQRLWAEMRREYGAAFDRQWQCPAGVEPCDHVAGLMLHWARKLSQFKARPHAIRYGLDNLPPHPPSLPEFVAICKQAPDPPTVMLNEQKSDPAVAAAAIKAAQEIAHIASAKPIGNKDWAWRMRDRELNHGGELESGCMMRQFHRDAWRQALRHGKYALGA